MFSVKAFLDKYGKLGVGVYSGVTVVNMGTIYVALRSDGGQRVNTLITAPLKRILGEESLVVQDIKQKLGQAEKAENNDGGRCIGNGNKDDRQTGQEQGQGQGQDQSQVQVQVPPGQSGQPTLNIAREGAYLGVASIIDSVMLPIKLAICLPITKYILKRRGVR